MSIKKCISIICGNQFKASFFLILISISSFSQVGIGTTTPDASSVLDVTATDKGLLIPRVSLSNVTTTMLDGTNAAATGLLIYNTNAGVIGGNGLGYYYFNGTNWEQLSTSSTSNDHDFYEESTTSAPSDINDDIYTHGNLAIGKTTADYPMDIYSTTANRGINIELSGADDLPRSGIRSVITNTGLNGHTGFTNFLTVNGNGNHWGIRTQVSGSGSGWKSANMNSVHGPGTGTMIGTHNNVNGTGNGLHGGTDNLIQNEGDGIQFGTRNQIINNRGHGLKYGVLNEIESTGNGDHYGNYSLLTGTGTGDKYGSYNEIESSAGGTPYGVFSKVDNFGGYAGYFLGRVSLGTATTNSYILPLSRGTANQIMQTDGTGNVNWVDSSSLGSDDHDWYEEGTTNSPNSINNDIYTQGNVAIGKTTANYALDIEETAADRAINVRIDANGTNSGIHVVNSSTGATLSHGIYNDMRGGDGIKFAVRNEMSVSNNNSIQGVLNNMTGNGPGVYQGVNNFIDASGTGDKFGCFTRNSSNAQGDIYGVYSAVSGNTGLSFSGFFVGDFAIGTEPFNSVTPNHYVLPSSRGMANQIMQTDGAGNVSWVDDSTVGTDNQNISGSGLSGTTLTIGIENGTSEIVDLSSLQDGIGTDNQNIFGSGLSGTNLTIGIENGASETVDLSSLQSNHDWYEEGTTNAPNNIYEDIYTHGNVAIGKTTASFPIDIEATTSDRGVNIVLGGIYNTTKIANNNTINTSGFGWHYGTYSRLHGIGIGDQFGAFYDVANSGNGIHYGTYNRMVGTGTGNKYGSYSNMATSAGGTHYGVYSSALKTGSFAGYFLGDISVGTTTSNNYILPDSRGTNGQIMQTDGSGNVDWVNMNSIITASNGLTDNTGNIELGGTLSQATTIIQGANSLTFNLNSSGDFIVQDNGSNHFEVRDSGNTYIGGDTYWNDINTTGTIIAALTDDGDDGRFRVYENGSASVDLDANTGFVFNEQGLDRDFRIESDDETNLFRVDAANNRIGIMEATPDFDIHLKQSSNTEGGVGGIGLESSASTNNWKIYHSGANLSFAENGVRRGYIATTSGLYMDTSDRRLKKNIAKVESILQKVNKLEAYRYLYKDQVDSGKKILGFMAQEVQPLFPELVGQAEDGYFALNYAGFSVLAVKAIQEQQNIIESQQKQIDELQNDKAETNKTLRELLQRVENLEAQN